MNRLHDVDLELKDAGLIAASAACEVSSVAKIIDLGSGKCYFDVIIDVTAAEVDTGDERYDVEVQVSSSATFASAIHTVATKTLGDAATLIGDVDQGVGRYVLPAHNLIVNEAPLRYMRLYTKVAGTIATGVNYSAWATKKQHP